MKNSKPFTINNTGFEKWKEFRRYSNIYLVSANHLSIVAYRDIFGIGVTISNGSLYIQLGHLEFTWY